MTEEMRKRQERLVAEFSNLSGWEEKYKHIIQRGQRLEALPDNEKAEDLKVKGCQSQVWLKAEVDPNGFVIYRADSDAMIVKGLVALLLDLYSGARPKDILATAPDFVQSIELQSHLSPSRANGLVAMVKQIKYYAMAFQAMEE